MPTIPDILSKVHTAPQPSSPVWEGPESTGNQGGVTFSLLSRFLQCRERFRLYVVDGLAPQDRFNHKIEFGNMWHLCEESLATPSGMVGMVKPHPAEWEPHLSEYARDLCKKYPQDMEQVSYWYDVCKRMFPLYVDHWQQRQDVKTTPLLAEEVFRVAYKLPSGRVVYLRGKIDSLDRQGQKVYHQENKTKGEVNEGQIRKQLTFDLQTMLYSVALHEGRKQTPLREILPKNLTLAGVRYNVVRRPLHRQGKKETRAEFLDRLVEVIKEDPTHFFKRWRVEISPKDVSRFVLTCLDPILEQVCHWYEVTVNNNVNEPLPPYAVNYRHPYGVRNILDEGGSTDLDEHILTGSTVGLRRVTDLFPELRQGG